MYSYLVFFCIFYLSIVNGVIYDAKNVPVGKLPLPLSRGTTSANILLIGAGSGGSTFATLAAQQGLSVLVLDDGFEIDFNDSSIGVVPGTEYAGYYHPGLERSWLSVPNSAVSGFQQLSYGTLVRDVQGGDMRLSHYAIEMGSSAIHREQFYEAYGCPAEWSPEYVWGPVVDRLFNFSGPHVQGNHANLGINGAAIRAQESRNSSWQEAWIESCVSQVAGARAEYDFNILNGSIMTCGGEPSNVKTNGIRSISENEFLIPEALKANSRITFIRDTKVSKILFDSPNNSDDSEYDCENNCYKPRAIGVEGTFRNIPFRLKFSPSNGGDTLIRKYRKVVLNVGTIPTAQLLKLSGIGPAEELQSFNIPVIRNISAVGKHLREGSVTFQQFNSNNATARDIYGYDFPNVTDLITTRPGAFVEWNPENYGGPLKMFFLWTPSNFGSVQNPFIVGYTLPFEMEQELEGSVTLISPNLADYPRVDYGWTYEHTIAKHIASFKLYRKIINNGTIASRFQMYEAFPGADAISDEALGAAATQGIQAMLHASGTSQFALNNDTNQGVVDLNNNVIGVQDLKIISMSVFPYLASSGGQTWSQIIAFNAVNKILTEVGLPIIGPNPQSYASTCNANKKRNVPKIIPNVKQTPVNPKQAPRRYR